LEVAAGRALSELALAYQGAIAQAEGGVDARDRDLEVLRGELATSHEVIERLKATVKQYDLDRASLEEMQREASRLENHVQEALAHSKGPRSYPPTTIHEH